MPDSDAHAGSRLPQSDTGSKAPRRRTQGKLPRGCRFVRDASLAPDPLNPVSTLSPEHRSAERARLIAEVLARIALAGGPAPPATDTQ